MGDKAGGQAGSATCSVIFFIGVGIKAKGRSIRTVDRVVLDIVCGIVQRIRIGFDLGIKSTKVLASGVVYFNVIRRTGRLIVVVQRLARYQLVGSRSICSLVGCTCSERTCTKSLASGVFISLLLFFCCIRFRDGFSIVTNGIGLQITAYI